MQGFNYDISTTGTNREKPDERVSDIDRRCIHNPHLAPPTLLNKLGSFSKVATLQTVCLYRLPLPSSRGFLQSLLIPQGGNAREGWAWVTAAVLPLVPLWQSCCDAGKYMPQTINTFWNLKYTFGTLYFNCVNYACNFSGLLIHDMNPKGFYIFICACFSPQFWLW